MDIKKMKQWKIENLDSKSATFCGSKWYNASVWLSQGWTTSCHHNPPHAIDIDAIAANPMAMHNTPIKKQERAMMQQGLRPKNCQFCWVMEDTDPTALSDRVWTSWGGQMTPQQLDTAFVQSSDDDFDLTYLEFVPDRTCNLGCSYCAPSISTTWSRDITQNGPYQNLPTDHRRHYATNGNEFVNYKYGDANPYADAFFKWWDSSLHKTIKQIRISGGEPMMSGHTWKLMDWLADHAGEADCRVEMTTNLAYDQDTLMRFLEACSRVSVPIWLFTSGECTEKKIEYVRDGLDWELWNQNIDHVLNSGVIAMTGICGTLSAASADGFTDFLYWLADRKRNAPYNPHNTTSLMLSVNPVRFPTFQNVVILPPALRLQYSKEIEEFLLQANTANWFAPIELDHIKRYSTYLREVTVPHEETQITHLQIEYAGTLQHIDTTALGRDFKSFFSQYDQRRNQNFVQTFPRLSEWYAGL